MNDPTGGTRAVIAMFALNGLLLGTWASRIPAIAEALTLSKAQLGLLLLCIGGGAIASFPFAGTLSDRHGAAALSRILGAVNAVGLVLAALAPNGWTLALALIVFGAGHGGQDVAMNGWGAEVERGRGRPVMSFFHATWSLGAGIGAALGAGAVWLGVGVAAHFWAVGLVGAALALWAARAPWASPRSAEAGPVFALPAWSLVPVGFVAMTSSMGEGAVADWSALFLIEVSGATEARAALGYALFSAVMVAMRLSGTRIIEALGPVRAARGSALAAVAGIALAVGLGGEAAVLAGFALMGVGYALIFPLAFSRAANDPVIPQGRAIAGVATLGYGGLLLGPVVIGALAAGIGLRWAMGLLAVLALLSLWPAGRLRGA